MFEYNYITVQILGTHPSQFKIIFLRYYDGIYMKQLTYLLYNIIEKR